MRLHRASCAVLLLGPLSNHGQLFKPDPARIPERVSVNWLDTKVQPVLPPRVLASGLSGTVVLHVIIAADGHVETVDPLSGPIDLYRPFVQAVKQWTYSPYVWNGRKLRVDTLVTLTLSKGAMEPFEPQSAGMPGAGLYAPIAPQAPSPQRVRVSSGVMAGQLVHKEWPVYPPIAKEESISGATVLHVLIGKDGKVLSVTPVSGPQVVRSAAMEAVRHWEYKPFLLNGQAVEVETTVTLNIDFGG